MTLRRPVLLSMVAACAALAGCGSDNSADSGSAPATTAAAASVPATTPATTTPTETTATTTEAQNTRTEPITVKGKLGDALTLVGQSGYKKPSQVKVKITVKRLTGPFSGFNLPAGRKLIGLEVRFTNVGKKRFDDALPGGKLTVAGGESGKQTNLISTGKASPCENPSLKLGPGESKDLCIAYDIPTDAKPETFEYGVDSGYGDTGLWRLR